MFSAEQVDVLIVGTGPSGSSVALHLLQQDPAWAGRITMIDKAVHPREKLCGGGITHLGQHILARLGLPLAVPSFEIKEARLYYKDQSISFYGDPVFRIVRRDEFDHWLVQMAEKQGVTVHQGEAVKSIAYHDDYAEVTTSRTIYHAQILIGADGSKSFVRRSLKLDENPRVARLIEILTPEDAQQRFEFREAVAVFDFTAMTEGDLQGYYWDFPSFVQGQPFMNRGVFDSRTHSQRPKANLKTILRQAFAQRDRNLDDYQLKGHPIRWWDKNGRVSAPHVILVGDAAGADPFVGEGISFALGHGPVASAAISEAFAQKDFSFATYQERLVADPLIQHLSARTRLARLVYLFKSPLLMRLLWFVLKIGLRRSRWADPNFAPDEAVSNVQLSVVSNR